MAILQQFFDASNHGSWREASAAAFAMRLTISVQHGPALRERLEIRRVRYLHNRFRTDACAQAAAGAPTWVERNLKAVVLPAEGERLGWASANAGFATRAGCRVDAHNAQ